MAELSQLEQVISEYYTDCANDEDGWYRCTECNLKIFYSPRKPESLVQHEENEHDRAPWV